MTSPTPLSRLSLLICVVFLPLWGYAQESGETQAQEPGKEEAEEIYLEPLLAVRDDEEAYTKILLEMGDKEILRLEELDFKLRMTVVEPAEAKRLQEEMVRSRTKLDWLCASGLACFAESAEVRNFRGNVYFDILGQDANAAKEWHMAVSLDSSFAEPYNNLGMYYFHMGRYPLGFQNMDKALELEPNNPDFCYNMAQNYLIFGPQVQEKRNWSSKRVYKEAMKFSRRAVKGAPDDYQLLEDYAVNFIAAENFGVKADWKDAARAWQAAREHAPNDVKLFYTWLNEGRMWIRLDREKEARQCLENALKILPGNDIATRLLEKLGDE